MLLIISFFSISPMHVRRRLPYIIKDDSSEGLQNSLTNNYSLIIFIYLVLYFDLRPRKCCIVIFIVIRSSHLRCSMKKENEACNFIKKETLAQVFSCEFCEISKNTFFIEHLWTAASV